MAFAWDEVFESHYLETSDGLFFAVKGHTHPPDRVVGCLRYAPDPEGDRVLGVQHYRRLYHFMEQEDYLRFHFPDYLAFDPVLGVAIQSVPRACVTDVYDPRARLAGLRAAGRSGIDDPLIADCLDFADLLQEAAGVPPESLGISGSLLIGMHRPESDLDMVAYGIRHGWAIYAALHRMLDDRPCPDLRRLDPAGQQTLYAERVADTRMALADFLQAESRKVNQGQFRRRPYFFRFVPLPGEIAEKYGERFYSFAGRADVHAGVTDSSLSIFTPCTYAISDVEFTGGSPVPDLREIVSYRGRFCEQARAGDRVRAAGTLERVVTRDGQAWHRLLLGNSVNDVMIALEAGRE